MPHRTTAVSKTFFWKTNVYTFVSLLAQKPVPTPQHFHWNFPSNSCHGQFELILHVRTFKTPLVLKRTRLCTEFLVDATRDVRTHAVVCQPELWFLFLKMAFPFGFCCCISHCFHLSPQSAHGDLLWNRQTSPPTSKVQHQRCLGARIVVCDKVLLPRSFLLSCEVQCGVHGMSVGFTF